MDISSPKSTAGRYIRISSGLTDVEGILLNPFYTPWQISACHFGDVIKMSQVAVFHVNRQHTYIVLRKTVYGF